VYCPATKVLGANSLEITNLSRLVPTSPDLSSQGKKLSKERVFRRERCQEIECQKACEEKELSGKKRTEEKRISRGRIVSRAVGKTYVVRKNENETEMPNSKERGGKRNASLFSPICAARLAQ